MSELIEWINGEIQRLEAEHGPAQAFVVTYRLLQAVEHLRAAEKSRVRLEAKGRAA